MADDSEKQSRRARRRAERAKEAAPPAADPDGPGAPDGGGEGDGARGADEGSVAEIRDRNRKVRARAAAKRREKLENEREARVVGLDTGEMVDDAFARSTHAATQWLKKNFRWVQWVIVAALVGGIAWQIHSWRKGKQAAASSDVLIRAVAAELGRVGPPPGDDAPPGPTYDTPQARSEAAAKAYAEAQSGSGTGTAILATLGLANVLYDQGRYDEAVAKYQEVKGSALAANDADVRARAAEGAGLALEAKGDVDGALAAFKDLAAMDARGLAELGKYHQARLLFAKGQKDDAKKLIDEVVEKTKPEKPRGFGEPPGYLEQMARALQQKIDPEAGKKGLTGLDLAAAAGGNVDEQTLKMLQEVLGEASGTKDAPPAPSGAPAAP